MRNYLQWFTNLCPHNLMCFCLWLLGSGHTLMQQKCFQTKLFASLYSFLVIWDTAVEQNINRKIENLFLHDPVLDDGTHSFSIFFHFFYVVLLEHGFRFKQIYFISHICHVYTIAIIWVVSYWCKHMIDKLLEEVKSGINNMKP